MAFLVSSSVWFSASSGPVRRWAAGIAGLVATLAAASTVASAQAHPRIEIRIPSTPPPVPPARSDPPDSVVALRPMPGNLAPPASTDGATIAAGEPAVRGFDLLADGSTRDLMRNGFPARLHYRLELWTARGLFNHLAGTRDWDVVARYEPLTQHYRAARILSDHITLLGDFQTFPDLATGIAAPYDVPLIPPERGERYYYNAAVDVDMLSLRDLDEVERWLRGDLQPAFRGKRNPGTAVTDGLRTLFLRLIGAQHRHYEARSKTFTAP